MNKSQINATIVADNIDPRGNRTTSFELTVPRLILAEFNKHRMFSSNTSSSRAIPFNKMVEAIQENPFIPIAWQKHHSGMQGSEYITDERILELKKGMWLNARNKAIQSAEELYGNVLRARSMFDVQEISDTGVTKQLCNRLLEPFMWTTILVTTGEEGLMNFFELRCPMYTSDKGEIFKSKKDFIKAKDNKKEGYHYPASIQGWYNINKSQAEIHIQKIAEMMWDSYNESIPKKLKAGEYHIPYGNKINSERLMNTTKDEMFPNNLELNKAIEVQKIKIATALAARVSYTTIEDEKELNYEKLINLHDRLLKDKHFSCFEHCRKVMSNEEYYDFVKGFVIDYDENGNKIFSESSFGWCYNSKGFIPYRYIVENNIKI